MENFNLMFSFASTAFIVPLVAYLKKKVSQDLPFVVDLVSGGLSFGIVYGLVSWMGIEMNTETMIAYVLGLWKLNGTVHAGYKTVKKNKG